MAKSLLPVLFSTSGVAAAGVASYFVFVEPNIPENVEQPTAEVVTKTDAEPQLTPSQTEELKEVASLAPEPELQPEVIVEPILPTFSVLRVEPDGNAVIAGTGPANSAIELFDGEVSISKTTSGSSGDFAFVLDRPLAPGLHQLTLQATNPEGKQAVSAQAGLVNVPIPEKKEELTVLINEPGVASRVLQKSEPQVAALEPVTETEVVAEVVEPEQETPEKEPEVEATASAIDPAPEQEVAKVELDEIVSDITKVEVKTQTEDVAVSIKNSEVAVASPNSIPIKPVLIEAAEVEGSKLFIAGTGEPGLAVNLYLDGTLLGAAEVSKNGAFLFEGVKELSAGKYDIRADMSNGVSGKIVARAEVKLLHEPEVAEVQPEPAPQKPDAETPAEAEQIEATDPTANIEDEEEVISDTEVAESQVETPEEPPIEPEPETQDVAGVEDAVVETPTQEEAEAKVIRTGSSVIIRRGDNLWRVARRNYGAGIRYTTIFDANRDQIRNPDLIYPGQVLQVPESAENDPDQDQG